MSVMRVGITPGLVPDILSRRPPFLPAHSGVRLTLWFVLRSENPTYRPVSQLGAQHAL